MDHAIEEAYYLHIRIRPTDVWKTTYDVWSNLGTFACKPSPWVSVGGLSVKKNCASGRSADVRCARPKQQGEGH